MTTLSSRIILRALCIALSVLTACSSDTNDDGNSADSMVVEGQNFDLLKDPRPFTVKEEMRGRKIHLFGKENKVEDLVKQFYLPDTYTASGMDDVNPPEYVIADLQLIQGTFLSDSHRCEQRTLLLCTRGDGEEEYNDLFVLARDKKGDVVVSDKLFFEGSRGITSTDITVSEIELPAKQNCALLAVKSHTESNDSDLFREEWVEILIANGKGFRSLFRLRLEETSIHDFEATTDDTQQSSSISQRYEILKTSTNGLFDITVYYRESQNGAVIDEGSETYVFDGQYYVRQK